MRLLTDDQWAEAREDARRDMPMRAKVFRCGDRTCGAPDCASCYSEDSARRYIESEEAKENDHE